MFPFYRAEMNEQLDNLQVDIDVLKDLFGAKYQLDPSYITGVCSKLKKNAGLWYWSTIKCSPTTLHLTPSGTCSLHTNLNSPGIIQQSCHSTLSIEQLQSQLANARYPFTPGWRECNLVWSYLPNITTHNEVAYVTHIFWGLRDRSMFIGGLGPVQKALGHILFLLK